MISVATLAALIAFTPAGENQPEGDELTHIFNVVTQRKKDLGFTSDGMILSMARMYRYEFHNACMRGEI